jgi:hypothetical protein
MGRNGKGMWKAGNQEMRTSGENSAVHSVKVRSLAHEDDMGGQLASLRGSASNNAPQTARVLPFSFLSS